MVLKTVGPQDEKGENCICIFMICTWQTFGSPNWDGLSMTHKQQNKIIYTGFWSVKNEGDHFKCLDMCVILKPIRMLKLNSSGSGHQLSTVFVHSASKHNKGRQLSCAQTALPLLKNHSTHWTGHVVPEMVWTSWRKWTCPPPEFKPGLSIP
jgi:hypothetical protein